MKLFFFPFLFSLTAHAGECPNFSGKYWGVDGDQEFTLVVTQNACQSSREETRYVENDLTWDRTMIFDGTFRTTYESNTTLTREKQSIDSSGISFVEESLDKTKGKLIRVEGRRIISPSKKIIESTSAFDENHNPLGTFEKVFSPVR